MIFRIRHLILLCFFLFFLGFLIMPFDNEWVHALYGQSIYPNISALNQFLWSKVPFSIGDFGYIMGILFVLFRLRHFKLKRHIGQVLATVFIIVSLFYISWGLHYFKTPLRVSRTLPTTISLEHLKETTQHYALTLTAQHQQLELLVFEMQRNFHLAFRQIGSRLEFPSLLQRSLDYGYLA